MRKYLWYAIGEILLVVIGILLALQINNWNQKRLDNIASIDYEQRLIEDLLAEKLLLKDTLEYIRIVTDYAFRATDIFEKGEEYGVEDPGQFLISLYQASQITDPDQTKSTYQELKSSGQMNKVRDPHIRNLLITYYDYNWTESIVMIATSPYRESIRQEIPTNIQVKIRDNCGDKYIGLRITLSESCSIAFDNNLARKTVADVISNDELKKDLRFRIGNLDAQKNLIDSQIGVLDDILLALQGDN